MEYSKQTFDEWRYDKYLEREMDIACKDHDLIWISRWYPIGGAKDGPCWNLYVNHSGHLFFRAVFVEDKPGPLTKLRD